MDVQHPAAKKCSSRLPKPRIRGSDRHNHRGCPGWAKLLKKAEVFWDQKVTPQ